MIWGKVDNEWRVVKRYRGVDWSDINFSYEHKTQCPVCSIYGALKYERCW